MDEITPLMKSFISERKNRKHKDALDDFLESFYFYDENEGTDIFKKIWSDLHSTPLDPTLLTAPFRFIPLNEKVIPPEKAVSAACENGELHSAPFPNGLSGFLDIEIVFDGPMLIGDGKKENEGKDETVGPLMIGGAPVIPGATLRGLTRSTLEILAHARLSQFNRFFTTGEGNAHKMIDVAKVLHRTGGGAHRLDIKDFKPDFVEALFGYVHEPEEDQAAHQSPAPTPSEEPTSDRHERLHLKGRVSFGFARCVTGHGQTNAIETVMAAPKPSFGPFYLAGASDKDWSDDKAELAGRKRYPARGWDEGAIKAWLERNTGNGKETIKTKLKFLRRGEQNLAQEPKLRFEGRIHVHNVTPVELGGLIWALELDKPKSRHLIGRAKTAGAGQAQICVLKMDLEATAGDAPSKEGLKAAFETYMNKALVGTWRSSPSVEGLFRMCDPENGKKINERLGYLPLKSHRDLRKQAHGGAARPQRFLGA